MKSPEVKNVMPQKDHFILPIKYGNMFHAACFMTHVLQRSPLTGRSCTKLDVMQY